MSTPEDAERRHARTGYVFPNGAHYRLATDVLVRNSRTRNMSPLVDELPVVNAVSVQTVPEPRRRARRESHFPSTAFATR